MSETKPVAADITVALSIGAEIVCNGVPHIINPVRTGKLFSLIKVVATLTPAIAKTRELLKGDLAKLTDPNLSDAQKAEIVAKGVDYTSILESFQEYRTPIYELIKVVVGNGVTDDHIDEWEIESTIQVLVAIVRSNIDFFSQRVFPLFVGLVTDLQSLQKKS